MRRAPFSRALHQRFLKQIDAEIVFFGVLAAAAGLQGSLRQVPVIPRVLENFMLGLSTRFLIAAAALVATAPALAVTASVRVLTINGDNDQSFTTATPLVINDGGNIAAVQFAATPTCYGQACAFNGPAVTAVLPSGVNLTEASLSYSVTVIGGLDYVPILLSGQYAVSSPLAANQRGGVVASGTAQVYDSTGTRVYRFASVCLSYTYYLNESAPPENCGSGTFEGAISIQSGTSFRVDLSAAADQIFPDPAPAPASAYIDPFFQIDPIWAASHPGYSLMFETGVANGGSAVSMPSPVPEPETTTLLVLGLAVIAVSQTRRRKAKPR